MITSSRVIEKLEEVVAEYGEDYVYQRPDGKDLTGGDGCMYVHGDKPGCIAAQVFVKLGTPLESLKRYEGKQAMAVAKAVGGFTPRAAFTLRAAQDAQDSGKTWGAAVKQAKSMLDNNRFRDDREMQRDEFPLV